MDRFEKRLDRIKSKLSGLQTSKAGIARSVSAGVGSGSGKTPLAKLTESISKQEAFIAGKLITLENKFRAVKLPTEELDKAKRKFEELSASYKSGKLSPEWFSVGVRAIGRDLSDLNKQLNVPPPKFSRDINAGFVSQLAKIAKAQDQLNRNVSVKTDQFKRTVSNLENLTPKQIKHFTAEFDRLVASVKKAPWTINEFRTDVARLDRSMRKANATTTAWGRQLKHLKGHFGRLEAMAIPALMAVGGAIFHFGRQMDKNAVMLKTAFGSDAAKEMAFLRSESDRLGISLLDNVKAYSKIAFSLKLMGIEGEKAKEVFTAFSEASLAFGMSQDDLNRAFKAIEQMYSKGTAQAEEIRGQLTEAGIPGVWQIAAKSMDMTSEQFDKAVTNREIKSAELIENLSKSLKVLAAPGLQKGLRTIEPTLGRFQNTFLDISQAIYQDFLPAIKSLLESIRNVVQMLWVVLDPVFSSIGYAVGRLMSVVQVITAFMYDLMFNREKLFDYLFGGDADKKNVTNAVTTQQGATTKIDITVSPSEQAKRDLDMKIEKSHSDHWKNLNINVG